jgi:Domain of unknown function (DUF4157)
MRTSERLQRRPDLTSPRQSTGQPLDPVVRGYFEPLLGHDFSQIRIHTDAREPAEFGAAAYTVENDLTFAPGWFDPATERGRQLLAHELTHAVQQRNAPAAASARVARVASRGDPSELEAEAVARPLSAGRPVAVQERAGPHVAPGVFDWIEDTVSDVGSFMGDAASDVGAFVSDAAGSAWDFTKDVGSTVYGGMKTAAGGIRSATDWAVNGIDWLEDEVSGGAHWLADKAEGIPVLEQLAGGGAWLVDQTTQLTGGALKGATGLVGGVLGMAANPVDTVVGLEKMAEHASIPGIPNPLKALHGLYDVAFNDESWGDFADKTFNPITSMKDDANFFGAMGKALIHPYQESIDKGKYADAAGRGIFDVLTLIGTGGESAVAEMGVEGLAAASRVGEIGELAKTTELAGVATEASKAAEVATVASDASKAAEVATVAGDAGKATELANVGGQTSHTAEVVLGGGGGGGAASEVAAMKPPPGKQYLDPWPKDLGPAPPLKPHQVREILPESGLTPGTEAALKEGMTGPGVTKPNPHVPGSEADVSFGDVMKSDDATATAGGAPKPKTPEEYLIDEAEKHRVELERRANLPPDHPDYLSRGDRGPVLSAVLDLKDPNKKVHFGLNDPEHLPPADPSKLMGERIGEQAKIRNAELETFKDLPDSKLTPEQLAIRKAGQPGAHSEVYATDPALKAREAAGLPAGEEALNDMLLHNIQLGGKKAGQAPRRCFNCAGITEGVQQTSWLEFMEKWARQIFGDKK